MSESRLIKHDWTDFCHNVKEPEPHDVPTPLGRSVETHAFADASYASDKSDKRSQSGTLIFVNRAPIMFCSKK